MGNNIFAFFAKTEGEAFVISISDSEKWETNLKKIFDVNDAKVTLVNEEDWITSELKSKSIDELKSKYPKVRLQIYKKLRENGVPTSELDNLNERLKVIPNPISGHVTFAYLFNGNLSKDQEITKEDIQIDFFSAVDSVDVELVKKMIEKGADVNKKNAIGFLPLWTLMSKKNVNLDLIKLLIDKGAIIDPMSIAAAKKIGLAELEKMLDSAKTNANNKAEYIKVSTKSSKEGCFVATAVFEDYEANEVKILRRIRDKYLINTLFGKKFIDFYYIIGPKLAKHVKNNFLIKALIKSFIIILIKLLLKISSKQINMRND